MILENNSNYYEVLEITPDATQQEIRQAYLRLKLAYSKDSVALYTLVSKEETDEILKKIEEAYKVLSSEEKRREYDQNYSLKDNDDPFSSGPPATDSTPPESSKVVSIDRVPPMDRGSREEDLLVAPMTDFPGVSNSPSSAVAKAAGTGIRTENLNAAPSPYFGGSAAPSVTQEFALPSPRSIVRGKIADSSPALDPGLQEEIDRETEWTGQFLKRIRESRKISIEEMADFTKISRTYLFAIENEEYARLPASTYVRGFVTQVGKRLKLPHEKVAAAYVARYRKACPDKS